MQLEPPLSVEWPVFFAKQTHDAIMVYPFKKGNLTSFVVNLTDVALHSSGP
jgi:hypothetical protein